MPPHDAKSTLDLHDDEGREDTTRDTDDDMHLAMKPAPTPLANFRFPDKKQDDSTTEDDDASEESDDSIKYYSYPEKSLPVVSLQQGLRKKATPLEPGSWVKLALTLDGRDKLTKVCQYAARMLAWWFAGSRQTERFKALQASLTTSRKAFRLGRSMIEIQKLSGSGLLEMFMGNNNSKFGGTTKSKEPAWKIIGSSMKLIGLMGYFAGDNVSFLSGSGLFDDYRLDAKERTAKRSQLSTQASLFANRCYFFGALAGLVTGLRAYLSFRQTTLLEARDRLVEATRTVKETDRTGEDEKKLAWKDAKEAMEKAQQEQFSLFLALLKSCVDVMVFSNNPGIDLHQKLRGKKNHEGLHCLCGLISASTVLYNNFPDASSK